MRPALKENLANRAWEVLAGLLAVFAISIPSCATVGDVDRLTGVVHDLAEAQKDSKEEFHAALEALNAGAISLEEFKELALEIDERWADELVEAKEEVLSVAKDVRDRTTGWIEGIPQQAEGGIIGIAAAGLTFFLREHRRKKRNEVYGAPGSATAKPRPERPA